MPVEASRFHLGHDSIVSISGTWSPQGVADGAMLLLRVTEFMLAVWLLGLVVLAGLWAWDWLKGCA